MVINTVLGVPTFEIAHEDHFTTKIYKKLFKIFISNLGEENQIQSTINLAVYQDQEKYFLVLIMK